MIESLNSKISKQIVFADREICSKRLEALIGEANIVISYDEPKCGDNGVYLYANNDGLSLCNGTMTVRGDFTKSLPRIKQEKLNGELLVRAARLKYETAPTAIDATAGLGEDSLLLAASGFTVKLYEYDYIIFLLLKDAIIRAGEDEQLKPIINRMTLVFGNSIVEMPRLGMSPDLVYLDPMFPEKQKSALVKKKFQLIHRIERPCEDEKSLFSAALSLKPKKIVVKRTIKAQFLSSEKPNYSIEGKGIRYDCYVYNK